MPAQTSIPSTLIRETSKSYRNNVMAQTRNANTSPSTEESTVARTFLAILVRDGRGLDSLPTFLISLGQSACTPTLTRPNRRGPGALASADQLHDYTIDPDRADAVVVPVTNSTGSQRGTSTSTLGNPIATTLAGSRSATVFAQSSCLKPSTSKMGLSAQKGHGHWLRHGSAQSELPCGILGTAESAN